MEQFNKIGTGISGLDKIIDSLRKGDNVVWQVDSIDDYKYFCDRFLEKAAKDNKQVVYMRFAEHPPLFIEGKNIKILKFDAYSGFESFTYQVHNAIKNEGVGAYYIFDCLSDLLSAWATDLMIGNFFKVTCPYLFELDTITYFALLRNSHSYKTIARIREITQLLLDVYKLDEKFYVHPIKVWNRYSPTMFLPHIYNPPEFEPVTNSIEAAKLFSSVFQDKTDSAKRKLDYWDRLFMNAEELSNRIDSDNPPSPDELEKMIFQLCRIMISRDEKFLKLVKENFSLQDLLKIKERLIGTGYVGGKTAGMLLSRSILTNNTQFNWKTKLEPHDSFYIGSDVFYTYIVQNGWWKLWIEHKTKEGFYSSASTLREKMETGLFPDEIKEQFQRMLEYYGQSPIIIRSSSLLEDSFGSAFAGKYESIFNVNQGLPEKRYADFENSVKKIYASTLNEDALAYRMQRGLWQSDEQMALLVQRVSGSYHKKYFFPDIAGVGLSYNIYIWDKDIDPKAGIIRIVYGLGTRAVNRVEDDYPRIAALDKPSVTPLYNIEDQKRFSQHKVDLLNTEKNLFETSELDDIANEKLGLKLDLFAIRDNATSEKMKLFGKAGKDIYIFNFNKLFEETDFVKMISRLMKDIENIYRYPVEIEFTGNIENKNSLRINLLQCRPLQTKTSGKKTTIPEKIPAEKLLFNSTGFFMGGNINQPIEYLVYVKPDAYLELPISEKYNVARLIGKINKKMSNKDEKSAMLMVPGRLGTTTPSLGVPVSFSEINNFRVISETSYAKGNLVPELSFGTHFFQDLVETDIFYIALFLEKENTFLNNSYIDTLPSIIHDIVAESEGFENVVKVYDFSDENLFVISDILTQKITCFFS